MTQPPRDLLKHPLCSAEHLGMPIPDSPDACSTALPLWAHAIGYEEQDPAVIDRLQAGYPRFRFHPTVARLMAAANSRHGSVSTESYVFPSRSVAEECARYVQAKTGSAPDVRPLDDSIHAVVTPGAGAGAKACRAYWQHSGMVVSSRRARAALAGEGDEAGATEWAAAAATLRERIGALYGGGVENVWLFPSGMAAIYRAAGAAARLRPEGRRLTVDFPYLDTLKVQQELVGPTDLIVPGGPGMRDWKACFDDMECGRSVAAVMTEVPSNPLLRTADIPRLGAMARTHGAVFVIDDTIATPFNVDVTPWADIVTVSLTKFFCGEGDVLAGALIVNPLSPHAEALSALVADGYEDLLWGPDAVVAERRSRDFEARLRRINATSARVAEYLKSHPAVERLYYPTCDDGGGYEAIRRPGGGHGGVMSLLLRDAPRCAPRFYDALRVNKGPSLGTNYTLCCPYTILAHYTELGWAESLGVSRWLIRVSIGLEDADELCRRFEEAFAAVG